MKYQELVKRGREMSAKEIEDSLRGLMADPRMAAVAALIAKLKDEFADAGSGQPMAEFHGVLAHCAGSRHALLVLEGQMKSIAEKKVVSG
jgi:hypothetical protein